MQPQCVQYLTFNCIKHDGLVDEETLLNQFKESLLFKKRIYEL